MSLQKSKDLSKEFLKSMGEKRKSAYQKSFRLYGIRPEALQWASKNSQDRRFNQMVADVDFEGKTVLDVSCGLGDIVPYISEKQITMSTWVWILFRSLLMLRSIRIRPETEMTKNTK